MVLRFYALRPSIAATGGTSLVQLGDVITDANGVRKFSDVELVPRKHVVPEKGVILREQSDDWRDGFDYRKGAIADWCVEVGGSRDLGCYSNAPRTRCRKRI